MAAPRRIAIYAAVILAAGFSNWAFGQAPASDEGQRISVNRLPENDKSKLASWRDGKSAPETQSDQEILKRAAEYYIYQLTYVELQKRIPSEPLVPASGRSC